MPLRIFLLLLAVPLFAQEKFAYDPLQIDTLLVMEQQTLEIHLPNQLHIKPRTLTIYHNRKFMQPEVSYRLDDQDTVIFFFQPLAAGDSVRLIYQIHPFRLPRNYSFPKIETVYADSMNADSIVAASRRRRIAVDEAGGFDGTVVRHHIRGAIAQGDTGAVTGTCKHVNHDIGCQ